MSKLYRFDTITVKPEIKEEDFTKFMLETLLPYFINTYQKLTRVTLANLISQVILKSTKKNNEFIWLTVWSGAVSAIEEKSFEKVLMIKKPETTAMLSELDKYGKRKVSGVWGSIGEDN